METLEISGKLSYSSYRRAALWEPGRKTHLLLKDRYFDWADFVTMMSLRGQAWWNMGVNGCNSWVTSGLLLLKFRAGLLVCSATCLSSSHAVEVVPLWRCSQRTDHFLCVFLKDTEACERRACWNKHKQAHRHYTKLCRSEGHCDGCYPRMALGIKSLATGKNNQSCQLAPFWS